MAAPEVRPRPYAALHPFASSPEKAWPAERFAEIASRLREEMDVLIVGAAGDDFGPFSAYEQLRGADLERVKSTLAGASLFVGNDSGPAHMAAAFGLPVVVLYGASDPVVWAPWRTRHETLISPEGLGRISVEAVWERIQRLREARV